MMKSKIPTVLMSWLSSVLSWKDGKRRVYVPSPLSVTKSSSSLSPGKAGSGTTEGWPSTQCMESLASMVVVPGWYKYASTASRLPEPEMSKLSTLRS